MTIVDLRFNLLNPAFSLGAAGRCWSHDSTWKQLDYHSTPFYGYSLRFWIATYRFEIMAPSYQWRHKYVTELAANCSYARVTRNRPETWGFPINCSLEVDDIHLVPLDSNIGRYTYTIPFIVGGEVKSRSPANQQSTLLIYFSIFPSPEIADNYSTTRLTFNSVLIYLVKRGYRNSKQFTG